MVVGIGETIMRPHNDRVRNSTQVWYVLELNRNIISLDTLVDLRYIVMMKNNMLVVIKRNLEILEGQKDKIIIFVLE